MFGLGVGLFRVDSFGLCLGFKVQVLRFRFFSSGYEVDGLRGKPSGIGSRASLRIKTRSGGFGVGASGFRCVVRCLVLEGFDHFTCFVQVSADRFEPLWECYPSALSRQSGSSLLGSQDFLSCASGARWLEPHVCSRHRPMVFLHKQHAEALNPVTSNSSHPIAFIPYS